MIEDLWIGGWRDIERWVQALFASPDGEDPAQAESWPTRVEITHGTRYAQGPNGTPVDISNVEEDDAVRMVRASVEDVIKDNVGDRTQITVALRGFMVRNGEEQLLSGKRGALTVSFTRKGGLPAVGPVRALPSTPFLGTRPFGEPPSSDGADPGSRRKASPAIGGSEGGLESMVGRWLDREMAHREVLLEHIVKMTLGLVEITREQTLQAQRIAAEERTARAQAQTAEVSIEKERVRAQGDAAAREARAELDVKKAEVNHRIRMAEEAEKHAQKLAELNAAHERELAEARAEAEAQREEEEEEERKPPPRPRRPRPEVDPVEQRVTSMVNTLGDKLVEKVVESLGGGGRPAGGAPSPGAAPPGVPPEAGVRPLGSSRPSGGAPPSGGENVMARINNASPGEIAMVIMALNPEKRDQALRALAAMNRDAALDLAESLNDAVDENDAEEANADADTAEEENEP